MSIKTFFDSVGAWIKKIFGSTTLQQNVKATLNILTPVVVEVVSLAAGPVAGTAAETILADIQTDFGTVSALVQGAAVASGTSAIGGLNAAIASLKQNLGALLADVGVKNSEHYATIETDVNFFLNEITAIESALASGQPQPLTPAVSTQPATPAVPATVEEQAEIANPASATPIVQIPSAGIGSTAPAAHTTAAQEAAAAADEATEKS
jgi:hypothetical protein